jgi:hypothetical protein
MPLGVHQLAEKFRKYNSFYQPPPQPMLASAVPPGNPLIPRFSPFLSWVHLLYGGTTASKGSKRSTSGRAIHIRCNEFPKDVVAAMEKRRRMSARK